MLKSNVEVKEVKLLDETIGEHIGYDLGVKMVKDYFDRYGEGGAQFVGRNIIEKILSQPDCIGMNIYKGVNEAGEKTYVLVGIDKENNHILNYSTVEISGEISKKEGIVADRNFGLGWFDTVMR